VTYDLTIHARDAVEERHIKLEWLERVLNAPERVEADAGDKTVIHHLGKIREHGGRVLRVVFNSQANPVRVVTVYFDRKLKGKL
jgi:uncharacterized protein DUF4258